MTSLRYAVLAAVQSGGAYTARRIAELQGYPVDAVAHELETLFQLGVIEPVSGDGDSRCWAPKEPR